jgi:dihydrofolate synthase/folylpolyglutamate synthase
MYQADLHHPDTALEKKLQRLYELNRIKKIDMGFRQPYLNLLKKFGNPHHTIPPVIHVAGTNGKGSIIALLRSMLEAAGYRVHAYTSPHLCRFNERIYLAGELISNDTLSELIDEAVRLNENQEITFFEITTAMAFAAFARVPADIVLLETGMGGRLDCTNIIEKPLATIISAIGYDHMEHLGNTLCKIAGEKAGIMKKMVPCIIAAQSKAAQQQGIMKLFRDHAKSLDARLLRAGAEWVSMPSENQLRFVFKSEDKTVDMTLPRPALLGLHQIDNAGAALAALEVIAPQFMVPEAARATGLQTVSWPGRMQDITSLVQQALPEMHKDWDVWVDGAHNEDGANILSTQIETWKRNDPKPVHLVIGMMAHKDPSTFLEPVLQLADGLTFIDIPNEPKSFKAEELKAKVETFIKKNTTVRTSADIHQAIREITKQGPAGRIVIAGSLYLAGHILKTFS